MVKSRHQQELKCVQKATMWTLRWSFKVAVHYSQSWSQMKEFQTRGSATQDAPFRLGLRLLREIRSLCVRRRVESFELFKLFTLVFESRHGVAPPHPSDECRRSAWHKLPMTTRNTLCSAVDQHSSVRCVRSSSLEHAATLPVIVANILFALGRLHWPSKV